MVGKRGKGPQVPLSLWVGSGAKGRYKTYYTEVYDKITHLQKDMI